MKQSEIIKEINRLLPESKLATVKYVHNIRMYLRDRYINFPDLGGLKESKESIDIINGLSNPGDRWIHNFKSIYPYHFKRLRYIKL